jgi:hypothetical protein
VSVLLLGGTAEARELAVLLDRAGVAFVSSLRVGSPGPGCLSARCGAGVSVA